MPPRSSPMRHRTVNFSPTALATSHRPTLPITLSSLDQINRRHAARSGTQVAAAVLASDQFSHQGYLLFDDTVLDSGIRISLQWYTTVERQRPRSDSCWGGHLCLRQPGVAALLFDFRLFDPERDGRSKIIASEIFDRVLQSCAG